MNLDPRTVVILTVLSTLLMSISLFTVARGYLAEMRGVRRWATGTLFQSIGWVLLALIGVLPSYIAEIGSPMIMLGLALYYHSLVAFKETNSRVRWVYVVVFLNLLAIFYYLLVIPNMAARIVVASSTAALLMFSSARILFSSRLSKLPVSHSMTGALFAACSAILLIRAIYYLVWNTAPEQSAFEHNIVQDVAFLTFFLAGVVSPFTFILMCNDHYYAKALLRTQELASKNDQLEEASRVKGQFLATMSHELRTPLNGVIGFLNQLGKTRLDDKQRDFLHTIDLSSRLLLNVINDVLDYSKIEAGKLSIETIEINLREFLDNTISMFSANAEEKGLDLVCIIDHRVPDQVLGDPTRLTQVLSNLLGNAIKFTEQGGVLLEVSRTDETENSVALQISISDTGIGISQQSLERLFQPFVQADASTTRKYGGTGLGLIIARRLVDMMKGSIEVESEMWRGTRFTINLELQKQPLTKNTKILPDLSFLKLLVVTGNQNIARSISENLSLHGIATQAAASGLSALALFKEAGMKGDEFDAIIFDHAVKDLTPDEFAAYLAVGAAEETVPLLLMGNISYCPTTVEMKKMGFSCCLYKPPKGADLLHELIRLFAPAQAGENIHAAAISNVGTEQKNQLAGMRVLIVDDNQINRKLVQLLVGELGGGFDVAENGMQALDACSRREYDAILMDINMPVMDGLEATRRIRALESASRRTPIFALTANALPGDRERFIESGMDDSLSKPINEKALLDALSRWCPQEVALPECADESTAENQNSTIPALDPEQGVKLCFGNPESWHLVLGLMLDELDSYAGKLDEFSDNTDQLSYWSHKLAGSSCYCGTLALHQAAKQLEISSSQGDMPVINSALIELRKQINRMRELDAAGKLRGSKVVVY